MLSLLAFLGVLFLLFFLVNIILYFIFAYALYKIAIEEKIENSWMAWIPILQLYVLGRIIQSLNIIGFDVPKIEITLPCAAIVVLVFNKVPVLGSILDVIYYILLLCVLYNIYKKYAEDKAILFTVLSLFAFPIPFIFMYLKGINDLEDNVQ